MARNREAYHEYFVEEEIEAGIELVGTEVKSIRAGTLNLKDAWCGIKDGDIVELYNDRGSVLCVASVTERVPVGVMHSYGCSANYDPIEPGVAGSTDRAGCVNLLTASTLMSQNVPGMTPNSCLCEIRKWEG